MKTLISIIIATYNRAHLITESLATIQNQTYKNWECLIIDDGGGERTAAVVNEYINKDSRFKYYKRTREYKKGLPGSRNQGLDLAKGNYIIFFDDDDIVHPENLQICINLLKSKHTSFVRYDKKPFTGKSTEIVFGRIQQHNVTQFEIQHLDDMITGKIPFASCCVMWDRHCFEKDRFNEGLMYAEEWECYSRILSKGFKGITTNAVLYFNRKHENSNTGEFRKRIPIRVNSQCKAAKLVINNLNEKKLFNENLKKFFVRLGFEIKTVELIKLSLKAANVGMIEKLKYNLGYHFYPILKPIFYLKGKINKN